MLRTNFISQKRLLFGFWKLFKGGNILCWTFFESSPHAQIGVRVAEFKLVGSLGGRVRLLRDGE